MIEAYIGLGSNLQNPRRQIIHAIQALSRLPNTQLTSTSSLYTTAPMGFFDQPDFLNAVCQLSTSLSPETLLTHLLAIEQAQHRIRSTDKNGPRTLDLDILLYGTEHISTQQLTIPHPRLTERAFVMMPLMEIAPDLVLPDGRLVRDIANKKSIQQQLIKTSY